MLESTSQIAYEYQRKGSAYYFVKASSHRPFKNPFFKHKQDCKFLILNSEYVNKHCFLVSVV